MKKIALLLSCLAFAGNAASNGSILVNTFSFADLPPQVNTGNSLKSKKTVDFTSASTCVIKINACNAVKTGTPATNFCAGRNICVVKN